MRAYTKSIYLEIYSHIESACKIKNTKIKQRMLDTAYVLSVANEKYLNACDVVEKHYFGHICSFLKK